MKQEVAYSWRLAELMAAQGYWPSRGNIELLSEYLTHTRNTIRGSLTGYSATMPTVPGPDSRHIRPMSVYSTKVTVSESGARGMGGRCTPGSMNPIDMPQYKILRAGGAMTSATVR
jgi:hypothetical protein